MHGFLPQMQLTQLNSLKVNLPYNYYPSWDSQPDSPIPSPYSTFRKESNRISALGRRSRPYDPSSRVAAPYLLDASALRAHEDQRVVLVDVGDDRGHFVESVGVEGLATHHLRHPQWRVHVQAAKVVVNGQELR